MACGPVKYNIPVTSFSRDFMEWNSVAIILTGTISGLELERLCAGTGIDLEMELVNYYITTV